MAFNRQRMSFLSKLGIGLALLRARFLNLSIPLLVGWSITDNCQYSCGYCGLCGNGNNDLPTELILETIRKLYARGCRRIQFTGGEPLLRNDIQEILSLCFSLGLGTSISTNGKLVPDKIAELKNVGQVNISVDGPPEVQDAIRGKGSFRSIKRAIEAARKAGLNYRLNAVLSKLNCDQTDFILGLASEYKTLVTFQPVTMEVLGTETGNPLMPGRKEYRHAIDELIKAHRKKAPIGNSLPGLMHFRNWPDHTPILCVAGRIFIRIEADGGIVNCQRRGAEYDGLLTDGDIDAAIASVKKIGCTQCWSAPVVEASCIMQGKLSSILHLYRTM